MWFENTIEQKNVELAKSGVLKLRTFLKPFLLSLERNSRSVLTLQFVHVEIHVFVPNNSATISFDVQLYTKKGE